MSDVTFFWITLFSYLLGMIWHFVYVAFPERRWVGGIAGGLIYIGVVSQTISIIKRFLSLGEVSVKQCLVGFASYPQHLKIVYVSALILLAAFLASLYLFRKNYSAIIACVGVFIVMEMIFLDFLDVGRIPITKTYEYLSLLSWCVVLFYCGISYRLRIPSLSAFLCLIAFLLVVFASIYNPADVDEQLVPALQSYWLQIHVTITIISEAAFAIAFILAALYLMKSFDPELLTGGVKLRNALTLAGAILIGILVTLILKSAGLILPTTSGDGVGGHSHGLSPTDIRFWLAFWGISCLIGAVFYAMLYKFIVYPKDESRFGGLIVSVLILSLVCTGQIVGTVVTKQGEKRDEIGWSYTDEEGRTRSHGQVRELVELAEKQRNAGRPLEEQDIGNIESSYKDKIARIKTVQKNLRFPIKAEDIPSLKGRGELKDLQRIYAQEFDKSPQYPIYYRDVRAISKKFASRKKYLGQLQMRLSFPLTSDQIEKVWRDLQAERQKALLSSWLPSETGRIGTFLGIMSLMSVPFVLLFYFGGRLIRGKIPELGVLDNVGHKCISFGYPAFTFGAIIAGAVWAHFAWGKWWSWDPKEIGSLVVWIAYTVYIHQRMTKRWSGSGAAIGAAIGFLFCILTLVGNSVLGGLHAYSAM